MQGIIARHKADVGVYWVQTTTN